MSKEYVKVLKDLEKKKQVFEEVAQLVNSLHKLSSSLESIVYNSRTSHVAAKAHEILADLDDKQRNLSIEKVELRLEHLDLRIRDDISYFLNLANKSNTPDLLSHPLDEELRSDASALRTKIEDFKRKVKLCFAYRILLCENGVDVEPIELDVAPTLISESLDTIKEKEKRYQSVLVVKLREFHKQAKQMTINELIPESIRDKLMFSEHQLAENIAHLEAGKSISSIPTSFDAIDLNFTKYIASPKRENEDHPDNTEEEKPSGLKEEKQAKGFLKRAKNWLDSPVDVSWDKTK
jgi:hypothetical protein